MKLNRKVMAWPFILVLLFSKITSFADYEEGVEAAFSGDFDTAFREFTSAAEDGLSLAQYNLGILYFTGQGVSKNLEEAFKWTKAAAEQGHLNAQFNLGSLYLDGQGTERWRRPDGSREVRSGLLQQDGLRYRCLHQRILIRSRSV